ncbi:MAG: NAD-dependent epimerase/dehydratase family protein [Streptosporangiales bacterium]|nr:NAD-dependent epimerase/dehydratase family protein [Streptosporangiales bacterium]
MRSRVLVVGGCGSVGSLVVPWLADRHAVHVLDLRDPVSPVPGVEYSRGDVHDVGLVTSLADGVDSLVYMAMGPLSGWEHTETVVAHLDLAVVGLYSALASAHRAGVRHAVYTSSMSVYRLRDTNGEASTDATYGKWPDETAPCDATEPYALAKQLGERVCHAASAEWSMDTVCLRLCFPTADDQWPSRQHQLARHVSTSARDTAAALTAAVIYRGHGFAIFHVSGDAAGRVMSLANARDVLHWRPHDQCPP